LVLGAGLAPSWLLPLLWYRFAPFFFFLFSFPVHVFIIVFIKKKRCPFVSFYFMALEVTGLLLWLPA
jgi:hypothetical protein